MSRRVSRYFPATSGEDTLVCVQAADETSAAEDGERTIDNGGIIFARSSQLRICS
jgi:hypothetical protein